MNCNYLNANDVSDYMGVSVSTAYKLIQKLNRELRSKGYLTIAGKVSRIYFNERVYGGESIGNHYSEK